MATYRPSFIDVSGLTQGISQGLEMAAQVKRQEDAMAEARVNEYLKTYRPEKLRDNDIGVFTGAYNDYKQAALQYSKMNRSNAKPEQLASAKASMDKALGNLNSIYTNSAMAANKQAEYADYFRNARLKGYEVPQEVTGYINALSSTPVSELDVQKIPSAYSIDLVPKEIDYDGISKTLNMIGANLKDISTERAKVPYGQDVNGKPLFADAVTKYSGRDPNTTVDGLFRIAKSNPRVRNSSIEELNLLRQGVEAGNQGAVSRLAEIQQYFPNVRSINDVNEYMVFGLPFYRRQSQGTVMDYKSAEQQYSQAKDVETLKIARQKANEAGAKNQPMVSHPSVIINKIMEDNPSPNTGKGVDVSRDMGAFSIKTILGSTPIENLKYFSGDPKQGIQPYFRFTVGNQPMVKSPEALNSLIIQSTPDITFKGGVDVYKNIPSTQKEAKPKPISKSSSFIVNGKSYTKDALNKLGYSDQQIQQAINLGSIKIK